MHGRPVLDRGKLRFYTAQPCPTSPPLSILAAAGYVRTSMARRPTRGAALSAATSRTSRYAHPSRMMAVATGCASPERMTRSSYPKTARTSLQPSSLSNAKRQPSPPRWPDIGAGTAGRTDQAAQGDGAAVGKRRASERNTPQSNTQLELTNTLTNK